VRNRNAYYQEHPEELLNWEDALKQIKTDWFLPLLVFLTNSQHTGNGTCMASNWAPFTVNP
jgi:hypothetical protein